MTNAGGKYADFQFLSIERRGPILVAMLNRPEQLNALRRSDHEELTGLLRAADADDEVSVVVVYGAGRAFCTGADYELACAAASDPVALLSTLRLAREMVEAHIGMEKPVVCAVHGQTSGGGAAFALLSDIIVAERNARIGDCHVQVAMAAGDGGALTWPLAMGLVRAKRYLLTGDYIDIDDAERLGLVTEVVEDGASLDRAMEWAERLAAANGAAVRLTKRLLNQTWLNANPTGFEMGLAYEMLTIAQPEVGAILDRVRQRRSEKSGAQPDAEQPLP